MAESTYIFIEDEPINVGVPGAHDYTFSDGSPVTDSGISPLVFESGTGLGTAFVDNFEDCDLSEYSTNAGQITNSAYQGACALRVDNIDTTGRSEYCVSLSGLPIYPSRGDAFEWYMAADDDTDNTVVFQFGVQEVDPKPEGYELRIGTRDGDSLTLGYRDGTGNKEDFVQIDASDLIDSIGDGYTRFAVDWEGDNTGANMVVQVGPADDPDHQVPGTLFESGLPTNGGIGISIGSYLGLSSATTYVDAIKLI